MRDIVRQDWTGIHPGNIDDINRACTMWLAKRGIETGGMKQIIKSSYRSHMQNKEMQQQQEEELNDEND
jgi:hypothetical protein